MLLSRDLKPVIATLTVILKFSRKSAVLTLLPTCFDSDKSGLYLSASTVRDISRRRN